MISPEHLKALMADLESDRIERTESTNNTDKFCQAVCAFANDLPNHKVPGYLVVGVDRAGKPTGIEVTEQLLEKLGGLRSDGNILPLPVIHVAKISLPGDTLTERPDDEAEISGDLLSVMRELDARIKANITSKPVATSTLRESSQASYPDVAVREILMNAVMHRDYQSNTPVKLYWFANRIEIHSPGGLYGEVTSATLETRSSYRNPVLAETMKALGYVNRYGYGVQRAQAAMVKNGNPPVQFEIDDRTVLAILPGRLT